MHPEIISICLFFFVTAFTPGPNNIVASYSGFNFGVIKTVPHILGVTLGFTALIISLIVGLINIFKLYPLIQEVLKYLGTLFLLYLAFKISFKDSILLMQLSSNSTGEISLFLINLNNLVALKSQRLPIIVPSYNFRWVFP